jgi:broad-specificity NMP kinase
MRVVVAGGPRCGKTTRALDLGGAMGAPVLHTDDLVGLLPRGEDSAEVARWFDRPGSWVVEGVTAARALRSWLAAHQSGKPCDEVVLLQRPVVPLTIGQATMAKACETVWREVASKLAERGVTVVTRQAP